ncbi:GTPase domain-containing protein [Legionella saoudiensis]|uniref:GTPase domain-containing protein n=1 Tax=Legionella saoudiensis TaxID=1750561 RepID=UPI0007318836|nr:GTPase domain-containing protein [Legionella saoudiensis]
MKVFIFGAAHTGKTELFRQLMDQEATRKNEYKPSFGPDFITLEGMNIWDSPGSNSYKDIFRLFWSGAEIGVYCINLSKEINEDMLQQIKMDIESFQIANENAKLILVGTFNDMALNGNTAESIREQLHEFAFADVLTVTTSEPYGTKALLTLLKDYAYAKAQSHSLVDDPEENLNSLEILRDKQLPESELYNALNKLNSQVISLGLDADNIAALGEEVNELLNNIADPGQLDKTKAYNQFLANCDTKFSEKYHGLKAAVKTFATVVLITTLAASIFFGAGMLLGAWAGVSTFLTALAEGTTGAAVFAAGTSATNLASLTYFGNRFFQKPVKNAAHEFIESIKNTDIEGVNFNSTL